MPETNSIQMQGGMLRVMSRYKPSKIKAYLDTRVIGQDEAKKTLAVAVYNHMKRSVRRSQDKDTSIRKSNVILFGGTGCGKTFLAQCIADYMNVPCYIQDCTKITASGYVGSDVEDCVGGLLRMCKYDLEKAQHGIVVLDEIDKNASREAESSCVPGIKRRRLLRNLPRSSSLISISLTPPKPATGISPGICAQWVRRSIRAVRYFHEGRLGKCVSQRHYQIL